jgi:hypothetical protein
LPYTLASGTTCGTVNNYTSTIGGNGNYVSGEDRIFSFTPATSGSITISVTQPFGAYLGMFLYTGCPFTAYIGGVQNNSLTKSFTATVTAGTTYFLMLDHWATPNCSAFTNLTITAPTAPSYCQPTGTGANSSITNVVTSGGITNLSNASGFTAGGYANFTAQSCSQSAGATINFTLTYVSDPGTKIFIDWNNDLDFNDAGENVYSSNAYVLSTVSGSFAVPVGQATGNYRMRIVADWNSTVPVACPVGINGETEDYTFTVAAPPSCPGPTALVGTPISLTSATISWTAPSPAPTSGYQYFYSTTATAPTAGTTPSGSTAAGVTTANLSSLTSGTTYYFWVRSVCSVGDLSSWAGAGTFYVGYCVPVTTFGCTDGDVIARVVLNTLDNNSGRSEEHTSELQSLRW